MDDKIKRFLVKINFDEEYYKYLDSAKLICCNVDIKNKLWKLKIDLDETLPIDIYNYLYEKSKTIEEVKKVLFEFNIKNIKYLDEYFKYYLNKLCIKYPLLLGIKDNEITIDNNNIIVSVLNISEEQNIIKYKDRIINFLSDMGFKDINIMTSIDNEAREKLINDIQKKDETIKEKVKSKIIIGNDIKSNKITNLNSIISEEDDAIIEAYIFNIDIRAVKKGYTIFSLKISDKTDSIIAKIFLKNADDVKRLTSELKNDSWYRFRGYIKHDLYAKDLVLNIRDIISIESKEEIRKDESAVKRVELHMHTKMSQMDGIISYDASLFNKLSKMGFDTIGITDKNTVSQFPKLFKNKGDIKVLYGAELFVINDDTGIIKRATDDLIKDSEIVVFDTETTGLHAKGTDMLIEIGAVKIKNDEIIDRFDELINPGFHIPDNISSFTNITDDMVKDARCEEEVLKDFIKFTGSCPVVAQNARFDLSFIDNCFNKYNMGTFDNTVIDTMEISRALNPDEKKHNLTALAKRYGIQWDEDSHHRADYDAEGTAKIFIKMIGGLSSRYKTFNDLNKLINKDIIHKVGRPFHITCFAKNMIGLKNLYKIISLANTKYYYKTPRILKSVLFELRDGLILGSGCYNGEIFEAAKTKTEEELTNLMLEYDFIEINPPSILEHLVDLGEFDSTFELEKHISSIINTAKKIDKIVCATGDVHTFDPEDNIYRKIIVRQKNPGGGLHPLNRSSIKQIPNAYLRTTEEMLKDFEFLDEKTRYEIVVTNTRKIADSIEDLQILTNELCAPRMENSAQITKEMVYSNARRIYGEKLPPIIEERLEKELGGIIGGNYDVIYLIAQKLVKHSTDAGYIVGSRGSVGSSLVATFMDITEVNPLPPHYVCPKCKKSLFEIDGVPLSDTYGSGFDMPDRICECKEKMNKNGQNIPFETFLGFNADKTPDIDLNFSGEYQAKAHEYTKVLFGADKVFRAGTVTTVADKTAYGYVKGYCEDNNLTLKSAEIERLALGITGITRTTGQHPGGIVVVPDYKDILDFTPYQYPAFDVNSPWLTTHFEYHDIEANLLKLDILGHDDPTTLKYLSDEVKININDIPLDDVNVLSLFSSPKALGVKEEDILCKTGTLGIPEFGTNFVIGMLEETSPKTFAELIKISGLSHGTDVWNGNARDLILNKTCKFSEVVGCRDDIMVYLIKCGIDKSLSFKISEFIRKGKSNKEPEKWEEYKKILLDASVPEWYIKSVEKIKYMFPKAHAAAYVTMAFRVAWFKLYHPINYYRVYLSIRRSDFDLVAMMRGREAIIKAMDEIADKGNLATVKEQSVYESLRSALEMVCRGFRFENISLKDSEALMFKITEDKKGLIPPFIAIDGLGDVAANKLQEERNNRPFVSVEDLKNRGKISDAIIDKMRGMGVLEGLPEKSQLSLFDII